jgi:hypothetical protein
MASRLPPARFATSGQTFPIAVTIMSRYFANDIVKQAGIKQKI